MAFDFGEQNIDIFLSSRAFKFPILERSETISQFPLKKRGKPLKCPAIGNVSSRASPENTQTSDRRYKIYIVCKRTWKSFSVPLKNEGESREGEGEDDAIANIAKSGLNLARGSGILQRQKGDAINDSLASIGNNVGKGERAFATLRGAHGRFRELPLCANTWSPSRKYGSSSSFLCVELYERGLCASILSSTRLSVAWARCRLRGAQLVISE